MLKRDYVLILLAPILCLLVIFVFFSDSNVATKLELPELKEIVQIVEPKKSIVLNVPYVSEAPDGNWTGSWINTCEESSITMVHRFYQGESTTTIAESKEFMTILFKEQKKLYGSDANSNSERTLDLIKKFADFNGEIVTDPTIDNIKNEIKKGRPVISMHYGTDLQNPNIPFMATGSAFHVIVVIGFNDETQQFITHDNGDAKDGINHAYSYDIFMNSLHDYNHKTYKSDGPARVIFTSPKTIKTS